MVTCTSMNMEPERFCYLCPMCQNVTPTNVLPLLLVLLCFAAVFHFLCVNNSTAKQRHACTELCPVRFAFTASNRPCISHRANAHARSSNSSLVPRHSTPAAPECVTAFSCVARCALAPWRDGVLLCTQGRLSSATCR